jgi:hypothetical protein
MKRDAESQETLKAEAREKLILILLPQSRLELFTGIISMNSWRKSRCL